MSLRPHRRASPTCPAAATPVDASERRINISHLVLLDEHTRPLVDLAERSFRCSKHESHGYASAPASSQGGLNGVIIVAPSEHEEPDGCYEWRHTVPVPVPTLPGYVASRLPDAEDAAETATDEEVEAFLAEHTNHQRPDVLAVHIAAWQKKTTAGESRHGSVMGHISGAMQEAKAGLIDAKLAADTLEAIFVPVIMQQPNGPKQGKPETTPKPRTNGQGHSPGQSPKAEHPPYRIE